MITSLVLWEDLLRKQQILLQPIPILPQHLLSLYGDLNDSDSSVSGYPINRSDSNGYANTPTTGSNTSGDFSQTIETGLSSFTAIPFENGSTNISNKYLKFLGTVVSILILLI